MLRGLILALTLCLPWSISAEGVKPTTVACAISVNAGMDQFVCNPGEMVGLNGMVSDPFATYEWTPATGLSSPFSLNPTVTVTGTTTYTLSAQVVDPVNLVFNGDFNAGAVGFSSDYIPGTGGAFGLLSGEGQYAVSDNPASTHTNFAPCDDHTGDAIGNMMVINGAAVANQNVWCQVVPVNPGSDYEFAAWVASVISSSPAILQFSINGTLIGSILNAPSATCAWTPFSASWNSGGAGSAEICIVNLNTQPSGNDFALDDISFNEVCTASDEVTVTLYDSQVTFIEETVCPDNSCVVVNGIPYCGAGNYQIDLLTINGCDSTIFLDIIENDPQIIIPPLDMITCTNMVVAINPFVDGAGTVVNAQWTGPNGFLSNDLNILVNQSGGYLLDIVMELNGVICETSQTAIVLENIGYPIAFAGPNITLDCGDTFPVTLDGTGSSSGPGISYQWSGPGTSSPDISVDVNDTGVYTILVTDASNGCQQSASVIVAAGGDLPEISPVGGLINCATDSIELDGESTTPDVTYQWTGPNGFTDTLPNPLVGAAGIYYLAISSGPDCTTTDSVAVQIDTLLPNPMVAGGILTCMTTSLDIMVTNPDTSLTYNWTGPGGYSATGDTVAVTTFGNYTVTAVAANGCENSAIAVVQADANLPNATATGDTIDCDNAIVMLSGASTTAGVTIGWTGPNGFTSSVANPAVSDPGTYIFSVEAANGCISTVPVEVPTDLIPPDLTTNNVEIGCAMTEVMLSANSTTGGNYSWSGPNGFSSNELNPMVSEIGTYILNITGANGCTNTGTVEVSLATEIIDLTIDAGEITCDSNMVVLMATSSYTIDQYNWTGPNGFSSSAIMPSVGQTGFYNLTITTLAGCTTMGLVEVLGDAAVPDISATGGTVFCDPDEVMIVGNSTTNGVTTSWSGPNGFSSLLWNPVVSEVGTYTFSVTAANGCVAMQDVAVIENIDLPALTITGEDLACGQLDAQLNAIAPTATAFSWTGPNSFSSTISNPIVTASGDYTVVVTGQNGCTNTELVNVAAGGLIPDIAVVGGMLDCDDSDLFLEANSTDATITNYSWVGPNGFSSNDPSPLIAQPGDYFVTITNAAGCENTGQTNITQDGALPTYSLTNNDTLDCNDPLSQLDLILDDPANTVAWIGPNGFTSSIPQPEINLPGIYAVRITAANGCSVLGVVNVLADLAPPIFFVDAPQISCADPIVVVQVLTSSQIVNVDWSGPGGITGNALSFSTETPGTYTVTGTAINGCEGSRTFEVDGAIDLPTVSVDNLNLDCNNTDGSLNYQSSIPLMNIVWDGPNGFTSNDTSPLVNEMGLYTISGWTIDGCPGSASVLVTADFVQPTITTSSTMIDCQNPMAQINANLGDPTNAVSWTGPNGYTANGPMQMVTEAGTYTATVMASNGCTQTEDAIVIADNSLPVLTVNGTDIDCNVPTTVLSASANFPGGNFVWSLNNVDIGTGTSISVADQGMYTVTYSLPGGCEVAEVITVNADFLEPLVMVPDAQLNCSIPNVQLNPATTATIVSWDWTGPLGFNSSLENPMVDEAGTYTLISTSSNGCTSTTFVNITADFVEPNFTLSSGTIDCNITSATILADGGPGNFTYSWSGPNGFFSDQQNITVAEGGPYTLLVTGVNGCSESFNTIVDVDTLLPNFSLDGGTLTCLSTDLLLAPADVITGTYQWTGPNGFTSTATSILVDIPGDYNLTIIPDNGCDNMQSTTVLDDQESPILTLADGHLSCAETSINLSAQSNAIGNASWTGPNNFNATDLNPTVAAAGNYTLNFIDSGNGCEASASLLITEDDPLVSGVENFDPECPEDLGAFIFTNTSGGTAPYVYSIDGGATFSNSVPAGAIAPGNYNFVVQDAGDCVWETEVEIDPAPIYFVQLVEEVTIDYGEEITLIPNLTFPNTTIQAINWSPAIGLSCTDCLNPIANPTIDTRYVISIITEAGCVTEAEVLFRVKNDKDLFIPNVFSPNNDGNNDAFTVFGNPERILQIDQMIIADRWGEIVFRAENFPVNDLSYGWDGIFRGESMNPGVFVYYLTVQWLDGSREEFSGDVTLMR